MSDQLKTIRLYGHLGRRFQREYRFAVGSVQEAIRALGSQVPGFMEALSVGHYRIMVGQEAQTMETLSHPVGRTETIRIVPVVEGAFGDDAINILVGAAVVAMTWGAGGGLLGTWIGASAAGYVGSLGMAMVLGGVASMLANPPQVGQQGPSGPADTPSYAFGSPTVTVGQGRPVPLGYGEMEVGGAIISAGIVSEAYQHGGFGGACPPDINGKDSGTITGNGDSIPWMAAIQPAS